MQKSSKPVKRVIDKIVEERIRLFEADPEYIELCNLLPDVLIGKESGTDYYMITNDREYFNKIKGDKLILLSQVDWDRYEKFQDLCQILSQRYGLHWVTVEDLACRVKQLSVLPRLVRSLLAYNDPTVILPKDFDIRKRYEARGIISPPLAANEILKRVQDLDDKTKEEIKACIISLFKNEHGYRIVELHETDSNRIENKLNLDVCLRVPEGYNAREVAEAYRKVDKIRRDILASLGIPVPRRRRQSKNLMEAESLELLLPEKKVGVQGIVEDRWPDYDANQDKKRRRSIISKRYKGRKLLEKRLAE
jgi:hypothetical protein